MSVGFRFAYRVAGYGERGIGVQAGDRLGPGVRVGSCERGRLFGGGRPRRRGRRPAASIRSARGLRT